MEKVLHTFEAGRRGKPDELDSEMANLIASYFLSVNGDARFDLRVSGTVIQNRPTVRISGEVSDFLLKTADVNERISQIILDKYNQIHRTDLKLNDIDLVFNLKPQSFSLSSNKSAGDSGNPIAVAYKDTPNFLPWERFLAVGIRDLVDEIYQSGGSVPKDIAQISGEMEIQDLRADGKVSVEVLYDGVKLDNVVKIIVAAEHESTLSIEELREKLNRVILGYLKKIEQKYNCKLGTPIISINGAGTWNKGGWEIDEGCREAKPYRDGFASYGVQEDSFSGEDASKPSATGTIIARYIAVQIVASGLADFARVTLSYTIGYEDVGLNIFTNNTGTLSQEKLEEFVRENMILKIREGVEMFDLKNPVIFKQISEDSDYFQNENLLWNKFVVAGVTD